MHNKFQSLGEFVLPVNFRGASILKVQIWWLIQASFFKMSPQFAYEFRAMLLRLFGAKVGKGTIIRPTVTVTYPWKVRIGNNVWLGDDAVLYSLGEITIGDNAVVSQRCYLCAGDHDYQQVNFPIRGRPIVVGDECWIAADTFVAPGIIIGRGAVVGARSAVFSDMPAGMVCMGSPCKPVKPREMKM